MHLCLVEANDHHREVVRRVILDGVIQQYLGGLLRIGFVPDQIHRVLVFSYIPQLPNDVSARLLRDLDRRLTPSQATIRNSSSSSSVVSVVYGAPTTNSFMLESPRDRVTARTPEVKWYKGGYA